MMVGEKNPYIIHLPPPPHCKKKGGERKILEGKNWAPWLGSSLKINQQNRGGGGGGGNPDKKKLWME